MNRHRTITWTRTIAISVVVIIVLFLIVLSPMALAMIKGRSNDWPDLGNIRQAYGGASALLAGLGLCGIAVSLLMQRSQSRADQIYSIKNRQFELVRLALDNPEYL